MGAEECGHARVSLCFVLHYWISCQWNYNWCLWKVIVCCTLKVPIPFGCFTVLLSVFILLLERIRSVIFCYLLIWAHRNLLSHISELVWHHIVVHLYFNRAIYISIAFCYCQSVVRLTQLSETHYTHTRTHTNTHTHTRTHTWIFQMSLVNRWTCLGATLHNGPVHYLLTHTLSLTQD